MKAHSAFERASTAHEVVSVYHLESSACQDCVRLSEPVDDPEASATKEMNVPSMTVPLQKTS